MIPHVAGMGLATTVASEPAAVEISPNPQAASAFRREHRSGAPAVIPTRQGHRHDFHTERTGSMGENAPQDSTDKRVIHTLDDLAAALTERFLANADAGRDAANDELVKQFGEWKRGNR
jgi:hypothetical protein